MIEYSRFNFELNIELNHFLARFNVKMNNQNLSATPTQQKGNLLKITISATAIMKIKETNLCFKAADDPLVALFDPHVHVVVGVHLLLSLLLPFNALQWLTGLVKDSFYCSRLFSTRTQIY